METIKLSLFDFDSSSYAIQLFTTDNGFMEDNHKVVKYTALCGNVQYIFVADVDYTELIDKLNTLNGVIESVKAVVSIKMCYFYAMNQDEFLHHYSYTN